MANNVLSHCIFKKPGASCSDKETPSLAARRWGAPFSASPETKRILSDPSASYLTRLKEQLPLINHDFVRVGQGCPEREDVLILEDF